MKFVKAALASAVLAAFSAPVFAQTAISNETAVLNNIDVVGTVTVDGNITVGSEASAVTNNAQASVGNVVATFGGGNEAGLEDAANNVTGNIGVNVASGAGNAQSNDAALASLGDAAEVFTSAQSFSAQASAVSANLALLTDNVATLSNSVNNAQGNVGVNIASGSGNMQSNQMAAAANAVDTGDGVLANATGDNAQVVTMMLSGDLNTGVTNSAVISNALLGASGNVAANITAGYGNLQHNSLSIASAQ